MNEVLLPGGLVQALEQLIKISIITVTPATGRLWGGTPLTERGPRGAGTATAQPWLWHLEAAELLC